jgi:hypothetical protein
MQLCILVTNPTYFFIHHVHIYGSFNSLNTEHLSWLFVRIATKNILVSTSEAGQSCWTIKNHSTDSVGCVDCYVTCTIIF